MYSRMCYRKQRNPAKIQRADKAGEQIGRGSGLSQGPVCKGEPGEREPESRCKWEQVGRRERGRGKREQGVDRLEQGPDRQEELLCRLEQVLDRTEVNGIRCCRSCYCC